MSTPTYQLAEDLIDNLAASVSQATQTYTLGGLGSGSTYSNATITSNGATTGPYVISNGTGITQPWYSNTTSAKIRLDGTDADIEINGISLLKTMQEIQSRLNILQPNTALEKEWEELFELGQKYRALEQHIKDKQATWDKLKAMPPPEID